MCVSAKSVWDKLVGILKFPIRKILYGRFELNSNIMSPIMIGGKKKIFIGRNVLIRENSRIEAISRYRDRLFSPQLMIEDNVTIEQGVHLTCSNRLLIGRGTTVSSYVYISDTAHGIDLVDRSVLEQDIEVSPIEIGENSFIGTGAKIMPGIRIGKNVIVGANAVVTCDVPEYSIVAGVPAKVIKKYDFEMKKWVKI